MPILMPTENLSTAVKQKYIEDLSRYSKVELLDLRERQLKLLSNKSRLSKLPDKGERIQKLFEHIEEEIRARNEIDQAAELFSELNIVEKGEKVVTQMEWNGGKNGGQIFVAADTLDSDDDENVEVDPLKIIAQSRQTKLVKVIKPPKSLITEADLDDIAKIHAENLKNKSNNIENRATKINVENKCSDSIELEPHAINMIKKDKAFDKTAKIHAKFLPFRTTKSDVHNVEKEKQRKHGEHWENTAATPPLIRNQPVRLISLQESIEMERQHKEKLREQMEKQAEERLAMRKQIVSENISLLPSGSELLDPNLFFKSYRQPVEHDNGHSDDEPFSEQSDYEDDPDSHSISVVVHD